MVVRRDGYLRFVGGLSTQRGVNAAATAVVATLDYARPADADVAMRAVADHAIAAAVEWWYHGGRRSTVGVSPTPYGRQLGRLARAASTMRL